MADCDLLIVGAGISGLSMAHYGAKAGLKVIVLEKEQRLGGCLHSHHYSGASDGFWLELGAHSSFNSYGNLLAILESIRVLDSLRQRVKVGFRLFADGGVRSIPSQLYFPELALAPVRLLGLIKVGRTVADYYGHIVGQRNYAKVFGPAFDAVICQPADDYPADSLFQPRPRRKDIPRSFTFTGGLQRIADHLSRQPGIQIESDQIARALWRRDTLYSVRTESGEYRARALCLATPVAVAAELLGGAFPAIAESLTTVGTATVETVGVVLPSEKLQLPPIAGLIGRREPFYSVVSRDTVPDARYRGFTFHFRPQALSEAAKRRCIARVLNVAEADLTPENIIFKQNQLPALRVGHGERTTHLDKMLAGTGLALTGNYFSGVSLEDCVTRTRNEFERLRREGL